MLFRSPPGTQHAQRFRFKGHGMPAVGKAEHLGDLYATAEVAIPRSLTAEQRALFEQLHAIEQRSRA